jgi:signal transduction histidine kinase
MQPDHTPAEPGGTICPGGPQSPRLTELEDLARRLFGAHEETRRRAAQVLHDELAQMLSMLKLHLAALAHSLGTPPPSRLQEGLALADRALQWSRHLALDLRPSLLDDLGLPAALRWRVRHLTEAAGLAGQVLAEPVDFRPSPERATVCYRVAEEAVTNAVQHARARAVTVELRFASDELDMTVRDDGQGFAVDQSTSSGGLMMMRERVRLAGGQFALQSTPGKGTAVRVHFARPGS